LAVPASAHHIPVSLDVNELRTSLGTDEGYLSFHFSAEGEERTGWTDIRHPSLAGANDTFFGFDRSDCNVSIASHTVSDGAGTSAAPDRVRDFEYASAAHVQLGLAVIEKSHDILVNGAFLTIDTTPELGVMFGTQRDNNDNVVNSYYIQTITGGTIGQTLSPEDGANNGIATTDAGDNDTMVHELGHFLIDSFRFTPVDSIHNGNDNNELMAPGGSRNKPTSLLQVGRPNGNIGGRDQEADLIHLKTVPNPEFRQERIYNETPAVGNPTVTRIDNGLTHGDIADFDWVEDNLFLEQASGLADNHNGFDYMIWEIGSIAPSSHTGHDHGFWGELSLPAFAGDTFRMVDVVSQFGIWIDADVDASGDFSLRDSYLDYLLEFSADGSTWVSGTPVKVFIPGWTNDSFAEDYVARWESPVAAKFVRISEIIIAGHDGHTQIDAVIATNLPVDIEVTKTVASNFVVEEAEPVMFTITATNNGPDDATGIEITDVLPAGLTFVSSSTDVGTYDSGSGLWIIGSLLSGTSGTLTMTFTTDMGTGGTTITNTATLTDLDQSDVDPSNNSASVDVLIQAPECGEGFNLSNFRWLRNPPVSSESDSEGLRVTFRANLADLDNVLTFRFTGPVIEPSGERRGLQQGDDRSSYGTGSWTLEQNSETLEYQWRFRSGIFGGSIDPAGNPDADGNFPAFTQGVLINIDGRGAARLPGRWELTLTESIASSGASCTKLGELVSADPGFDPEERYFILNGHVLRASPVPSPSLPGEEHTIVVQSSHTVFDIAQDPPASIGSPKQNVDITWILNQPSGGDGTVSPASSTTNSSGIAETLLTVGTTVPGSYDVSANGYNASNAESFSTEVLAFADIGLTKTADTTTMMECDHVQFTIAATNNGPHDATGVVITDLLPAGLTFFSSSAGVGTYNSTSGNWSLGSLAAGAEATLILDAVADVGFGGTTITNTVALTLLDQTDANAGNNSASANVNIVTGPDVDIGLTKTASPNPVLRNGTVTFTLNAKNYGTGTAPDVEVVDLLPIGLSFSGSNTGVGSYDPVSGIWSLGSLAAGVDVTLTLDADPDPGTGGTAVTNTATFSDSGSAFCLDQNPSNNSASVQVGIASPGGGGPGPPGVPDGSAGSSAMTVTSVNPGGTSLEISWDTLTCDNTNEHQIIFGQGSQLPAALGGAYALSGSMCSIGGASPYVWNSVPNATDGTGLIWWLMVVNDGTNREGSWGKDSTLAERDGIGLNGSSAECGVSDKSLTNLCGQ